MKDKAATPDMDKFLHTKQLFLTNHRYSRVWIREQKKNVFATIYEKFEIFTKYFWSIIKSINYQYSPRTFST